MNDIIKKNKTKILDILKQCGLPDNLFARCIGIYFILSAVHIIGARQLGINALDMWQEFTQIYSLKMTLIWLFICFCFISLLYYYFNTKSEKISEIIDPILLIGGSLFFSCALMWRDNHLYRYIGVSLTMAVFIIYGSSKLKEKVINNISAKAIAITVILLSTIVLGFVCITAVAIHKTFSTSCFDMGTFAQMFYSMLHNWIPVTTCERDMFLSHFDVHASYIIYLLVPVYALFPNENTLIVSQAVIIVSGIIPLFLIAKNRKYNGIALLSACMIYLFSNGILAPCFNNFHENAFLPPLLLWLMYAVEKRNYLLCFIMSVLVCIVKEDAPLYVICIALYLAIEEKGKNRFHAIMIFLVSSAYFLFITKWLADNGDGSTAMFMSTKFGNLMIDSEDGFTDIIKNVLSNPGYFISLFIHENSLIFFIDMLLPLAFFPFITKKIHRFLLIVPFVIMNLVIGSDYYYASLTGFHYTFGTVSLLIYLTIINISDFDKDRRNICIITTAAISVITAFSLLSGYVYYYEHYKEREEYFEEIEACLDTIPNDASVISHTQYLPHIADRDEIYMFDEDDFETFNGRIIGLKDMDRYDFYVLIPSDENTSYAIPYLEAAGYKVFAESINTVIYVSPNYSSDH